MLLLAAMLSLALQTGTKPDTRRVEVMPGFESETGEYEIDHVVIPQQSTGDDGGKADPGEINSTRGFASRKRKFAAVLPVDASVTVVFSSREHTKPYRHSVAGPFVVEAGEGTQTLTAVSTIRDPVAVSSNAEQLRRGDVWLELPLPQQANPTDERQDEAKAKPLAGSWLVKVPVKLRRDRETKLQSFENTLEGYRYVTTASAEGFQAKETVIPPAAAQIDVKLAAIEPLRIQVTTSAGEPIEGAKLALRAQPAGDVRAFYAVSWKHELSGTTDTDGVAELTDIVGNKRYDLYIDGGERGRSAIQNVGPGEERVVALANDPPLKITIKNIPPLTNELSNEESSKGEKPKPTQIIANERLPHALAITWIQHGPFTIENDSVTFTLPAPLGETIDFQAVGSQDWTRTLIINARGRDAIIDLNAPTEEVYVAPELAAPRRRITLKFQAPDRSEIPAPGYSYLLPTAAKAGTFAVSRRGPTDDEKRGRSFKAVQFEESAPGQWSISFPAEEQIRIGLDRVWIDGYIMDTELNHTIRPGEHDVVIDIPLLPAVDYELDSDDFAGRKTRAARIPFSSIGYDREGNNSQWIWLNGGQLKPGFVRVPAGRPTLLLINSEPDVFVKYLDGSGGKLNVDFDALQPTTIQAYMPTGEKLSSRIDGFVLPNSGISEPVNPYYDQEKVGPLPNGSSISATQAVMNLHANESVYVVLHGYGMEGEKQVVGITPGEHNEVTIQPGRTLWIDLLNPDGSDFRFGRNLRTWIIHHRPDGIDVTLDNSYYRNRYVGVPTDGTLTFRLYAEDFGYAEVPLEPDDDNVLGMVVELGSPNDDEPVRLTPHADGSTGSQQRNRERDREKRESR